MYEEEAIPERDPEYQLPGCDESTIKDIKLTSYEMAMWKWMVKVRPALSELEAQ